MSLRPILILLGIATALAVLVIGLLFWRPWG